MHRNKILHFESIIKTFFFEKIEFGAEAKAQEKLPLLPEMPYCTSISSSLLAHPSRRWLATRTPKLPSRPFIQLFLHSPTKTARISNTL